VTVAKPKKAEKESLMTRNYSMQSKENWREALKKMGEEL